MAIEQQYKLIGAYITSDSMAGRKVHVQNNIVELVLFESLETPFLTGQVVLFDDASIMESITFTGTEILSIDLASEEGLATSLKNEGAVLPSLNTGGEGGRTFLMSGIEKSVKSEGDNGTASTYVITLIEPHALLSKAKKISRTVKQNLNDEISRICVMDLKKNVDVSYSSPSVQSNFKAIIPYLHPLDACEWLRDRATTENGSPFFLYASIHDNNLRLGNLDVMLSQPAFNVNIPYLYSPSDSLNVGKKTSLEKSFQIESMKITQVQNTLRQVAVGAIGSRYSNTDLSTGQTSRTHFDVTKVLDKLSNNGIIKKGTTQNVYDTYFQIENKTLQEHESKMFHTITSKGTYGEHKSYGEETSPEMSMRQIDNLSIRHMLYKNMFDVTVPGVGFIMAGASVGDIAAINIVSDTYATESTDNPFDKNKSGNFLIYNIRHTFTGQSHSVVMTVCKIVEGEETL